MFLETVLVQTRLLNILFIFCFLFVKSNSLPHHKAMVLLSRYGYLKLPESGYFNDPLFARFIVRDDGYRHALLKFQQFFNLPQTGILDNKTEKFLTASRCGNPDFIETSGRFSIKLNNNTRRKLSRHRVKRYFIDNPKMRWLKTDLTWKIKSYPSSGLSRPQVRAIFTRAFNMWAAKVNLNFAEEENYYKDADIIIEFGSKEHGDSIPFDGKDYVLAHAFYPIGSNSPQYSRAGDAHFDDDENWTEMGQTGGRMLLPVAVHELGHSMGLGHSSFEKAIMYPFYVNPSDGRLELDEDDIRGMQSIYGPASRGKVLPPIPDTPKYVPKFTNPIITTPSSDNESIDFCKEKIDAVIIIREVEIYVFSGKKQWRIDFSKTVTSWISYEVRDGPESILYYWPVLPKWVDYIDGGIERNDQRIYMFRGDRFWILEDNTRLSKNIPEEGLPLTVLGLDTRVKKINSVFRWTHNKAIYIMAGDLYWKINEEAGDFGYKYERYPRSIARVWKNLPRQIDFAFTDLHGETYFVKGDEYYRFNNLEMSIIETPKRGKMPWTGCNVAKQN